MSPNRCKLCPRAEHCARNDGAYIEGSLLDLLIRRAKIRQRHRDGDGLLGHILERDLQLLAGFQRGQHVGRNLQIGVAAARLAGLDLQVGRFAVVDLNFAPAGRLSPSGNCTSATGARVSAGTRTLTSTINWPVLVRTALCSIAHSSGAPRLALLHRATQPGGAGAFAFSEVGAGAACATGAALFLALGA